jgi:predicted flap endonuclease-1-like 5' DNA nuclease
MVYLLQFHLIWMLVALVLGLAIGWLTWARTSDHWFGGWVLPAVVTFGVGMLVSVLKLLPGRWGYGLDLALLMVTVYIIGCCVGGWLKSRQQQWQQPALAGFARGHSGSSDDADLSGRAQPAAGPIPGTKPPTLVAPTGSVKDDLTAIQGIGPLIEQSLNRLGIFHFCQIANWTAAEVTWVSHSLAFPARIERERWVDQADILCKGGDTDYSRQVKSKIVTPDNAPLNESALAALAVSLAASPAPDAQLAAASPSPVAPADLPSQAVSASAIPPPSLLSMPAAPQPSPPAAPASVQPMAASAPTSPADLLPSTAVDWTSARVRHPGRQPVGFAAPEGGVKDDLKWIKGIGPNNERRLNALGVFHFRQIAGWTTVEASWMDHYMALPGRIEREQWIDQAKILERGEETDHSRAMRAGYVGADDAVLNEAEVSVLRASLSSRAPMPEGASTLDRSDMPSAELAPGTKPVGLTAPAGGFKDDLKWIKGIGPKNERALNEVGIFHFCQIADWTAAEATWMGHHMAFPGRIEREHWIDQAKLLCGGLDTEHSRAVRLGLVVSDDAPIDAQEAEQLKAALPPQMPPVEREEAYEGRRPSALARPRGSGPDDLRQIKGIGPQNERRLHGLGIWHFDQIANWSSDNVRWVGSYLAFPGRIDREQWIAQAKRLAAGSLVETKKQKH